MDSLKYSLIFSFMNINCYNLPFSVNSDQRMRGFPIPQLNCSVAGQKQQPGPEVPHTWTAFRIVSPSIKYTIDQTSPSTVRLGLETAPLYVNSVFPLHK